MRAIAFVALLTLGACVAGWVIRSTSVSTSFEDHFSALYCEALTRCGGGQDCPEAFLPTGCSVRVDMASQCLSSPFECDHANGQPLVPEECSKVCRYN